MTDRLRPEFEALARALAEPLVDPTEPEEREWFCPQCGVRAERYCIDEDGCCASCGATCCRLSELRALLAKAGLHLVPEADKASLDAGAEIDTLSLRNLLVLRGHAALPATPGSASERWAIAELARRGEKA